MTAMCPATRPDSPRLPALALLALVLAWATIPRALAQSGKLEDLASFPTVTLEIEAGKKKRVFDVWVASTPSRQAQGLMFVRSLPPMRGMLFVHQSPKQITMWMKNTYIPLDMVFIDDQGHVQEIVEHTTPHSLDIIRSNQPAIAVLEIAAGEAKRLGLKPGQRVSYPPDAGQ